MNFIAQRHKPLKQLQTQASYPLLAKKEHIRELIIRFFMDMDNREWDALQQVYYPKVYMDYTSLIGGRPSKRSPKQIIEGWKGVLPGYDRTHHQIGNLLVDVVDNQASVSCYTTTTYYLKNPSGKNSWTIIGRYQFRLKYIREGWKIDRVEFSLFCCEGNENLPQMAQSRMKAQIAK